MKKIVFTFFILFATNIIAQRPVLQFSNNLAEESEKISSSHTICNTLNGDLLFILESNQKYHGYLFDSDFKQINSLSAQKHVKKYDQYLGCIINGGDYSMVHYNQSKKKFGITSFNFKLKTTESNSIDFKLDNEKLIESFNYNNKLYLISVKPNTKSFNLHIYDGNKFEKQIIEINGSNDKNPYKGTSHDLMVDQKFSTGNTLKKVNNLIPRSYTANLSKSKLYLNDNSLTITFDKEDQITRTLSFNLDSFKIKRRNFYHIKNVTSKIKRSNSYIFNNKLFQIASSSEYLKLTITDLETNQKIKEYFGSKNADIYFKNGSINQQKTDLLGGDRKLDNPKQFLRKLSKGKQGLSVYYSNEHYKVSIGSVKPVAFSGGGNGFSTGYNNSGQVSTHYMHTAGSITPEQKSVWIDCVFDNEFNHTKGNVQDYFSPLILNFEKNNSIKEASIFEHTDNKRYRGVYITSLNTYKVYLLP